MVTIRKHGQSWFAKIQARGGRSADAKSTVALGVDPTRGLTMRTGGTYRPRK